MVCATSFNDMILLFRYLVVISFFLYTIFWFLPYFHYLWLNQEELNLLSYNSFNSIINFNILDYLSIIILLGWYLVSLGLFFFIKIAKSLFLFMIILNLLLSIFEGFLILSPIDLLLYVILGLLDGVILAILYLTSISDKFNDEKSKKTKKYSFFI